MYAVTRLEKRRRLRFQSNHHRGYFCRNTIIRTTGRKTAPPPIASVCIADSLSLCRAALGSMPITMRIGIAAKIRKAVASRLSGRLGKSTSNCTG